MSVHEIATRLKSLSESNKSLTSRISLLTRPVETQSSDLTLDAQTRAELSTEIHQELKFLEEEFELAKQAAEDITVVGRRVNNEERNRERVAIVGQVERLSEDLRLARAQFRKAQLQAKRNAEAAQKRERDQLFAGVKEGAARSASKRRGGQDKLSEEDILVNASTDVTAALRRTHQLMTSELQRSQFAHETLQRSTAALQSLNESYSNLDTLLSSSKTLVSTLVSSSKSDTWYLETAFWLLVYTLVWLLFRRIFYGPIRYLAYLPTKWMLKIFLSLLQLLGGAIAASGNEDTSAVSSHSVSPSAPAEVPLGHRQGRLNPALPRRHIPSGMGGQGAKVGFKGEKLSDKIAEMAEKQDTQKIEQGSEHQSEEHAADPEAEAEDEQWTAGDEDDHEEHGTVLREPEADETPDPKKRMWEEPVEDERHDEL